MTEEKQILIKDLCARQPYGVKCNAVLKQIDGSLKSVFGTFNGYNGWATVGNNLVDIVTVKPYLRPMSSMTEEEKAEHNLAADRDLDRMVEKVGRKLQGDEKLDETLTPYYEHIDWLNANHFDYRGLIEKGLALEAPEGMYNNKN